MKRMSLGFIAMFAVWCISLSSGCATIMNGDMVHVPVTSTPPGAKATVAGREYTTPTTVDVLRGKGNFQLRVENDGYEPCLVNLEESVDAWLWGNLVFGGLIGLGLDFLTGDAHDVEPEAVDCQLIELKVANTLGGTTRGDQYLRMRREIERSHAADSKSHQVELLAASPKILTNEEILIPRSSPGDKGKYYLLETTGTGKIIRTLHKRVGVDSTGYTFTETNCATMQMRELGYSEESPSAIKEISTDWFSLVPGSSKSDLANFVCK